MYTGVSYHVDQANYYLSDELGNIEVYSAFNERSIDVVHVKPANTKQSALIIKSHKDPMFSNIKLWNKTTGEFLVLSPCDGLITVLEVISSHIFLIHYIRKLLCI
jgi:hypothetical protein